MNTKDMEDIIYNYLWKQGTYLLFECAMPRSLENKYHRQRVDLLSYDTKGIWRFYELKLTVSDFYSKANKTFLGHYNYFVMPYNIYEKVKDDIPSNIGCWAIYTNPNNNLWCECVKKPKKQELQVNHNDLMFAMMQGLSREYKKYRKILEKET